MTELALPADLGIEHVAELHAALLEHLDDDSLELAGDQVARVHTAGLQLLHAFVRERAQLGRSTRMTRPSAVLSDAARQLALAISLGLDGHSGGSK